MSLNQAILRYAGEPMTQVQARQIARELCEQGIAAVAFDMSKKRLPGKPVEDVWSINFISEDTKVARQLRERYTRANSSSL